MVTPSSEDLLINRLSRAFASFSYPSSDVSRIREELVRHRATGSSDGIALQDTRLSVTPLADVAVRARFGEINLPHGTRNFERAEKTTQSKAPASLRSHLDLLKLRRLRDKTNILRRYTGELEREVTEDNTLNFISVNRTTAAYQDGVAASSGNNLAE